MVGYAPTERKVGHLRGSLPKLKEKLMEAYACKRYMDEFRAEHIKEV